jgi:phosphoglucomutase/phosphomannomutase
MQAFRDNPPESLAELRVKQIRDYQAGETTQTSSNVKSTLAGPKGNLVILDLEDEGNYVAVRPSGTEPKIKLYVFTRLPSQKSADIDIASQRLEQRVGELEKDIRSYAQQYR